MPLKLETRLEFDAVQGGGIWGCALLWPSSKPMFQLMWHFFSFLVLAFTVRCERWPVIIFFHLSGFTFWEVSPKIKRIYCGGKLLAVKTIHATSWDDREARSCSLFYFKIANMLSFVHSQYLNSWVGAVSTEFMITGLNFLVFDLSQMKPFLTLVSLEAWQSRQWPLFCCCFR